MSETGMPGFPATTRWGYRILGVENGCIVRTMTPEEHEYIARRCYEAVMRLAARATTPEGNHAK